MKHSPHKIYVVVIPSAVIIYICGKLGKHDALNHSAQKVKVNGINVPVSVNVTDNHEVFVERYRGLRHYKAYIRVCAVGKQICIACPM